MTLTILGEGEISSPAFSARAPGVTARQPEESGSFLPGYIVAIEALGVVAVIAIVVGSLSASRSYDPKRIREASDELEEVIKDGRSQWEKELEDQRETHKTWLAQQQKEHEEWEEEQRQIEARRQQGEPRGPQLFFPILNKNGLGHRFIQMVRGASNIRDWQISFLLLDWMLLGEDPRSCIKALEDLLTELKGFDPASRGLAYYVLSKMKEHVGEKAKVMAWLHRCKEETPLMYEHLIEYDSSIDLKRLTDQLKSLPN